MLACVTPHHTRRFPLNPQGVQRLLGRNASSELAAGFLAEDQYVAHGVAANTRGGYDVFYPDNTPPAQSDDDLDLGKTAYVLMSRVCGHVWMDM